jgi:hypothetical protein
LNPNHQSPRKAEGPAPRPVFFRITVSLFAGLLLFGAAIVVLVVRESQSIERSGGWGYLMAIFVFATAAFAVCAAAAVCAVISLRRGEAHRRLSFALLIVSALVVLALWRVPLVFVRAFLSSS